MKQLIHAKHWQLFLVFIGIPLVMQIIMTGFMTTGNIQIGLALTGIASVLSAGVFFLWLWSIGHFLYEKLPETVHMNLNRFRAFLIFPVVYIGLFIFIFTFIVGQMEAAGSIVSTAVFGLIIPLHLFAMFCIFYSFYFIAKSLKSIELDRTATFGDYAGEFFLIWFYFIGVWLIQPRINALANDPMHGIEDHLVD